MSSSSRPSTAGKDASRPSSSSRRGPVPGAPGGGLRIDGFSTARAVKHSMNRRGSPTSSTTSSPRLSPRVPPISTNIAVKVPKLGHGSRRPGMDTPNDPGDEFPLDPILAAMMPSFLKLDRDTMDGKFEDINWDERLRLAKGQSNHPNFEWKWGNFRQPDVQTKGLMDRYANIKPWNHNRVKLLVSHDQLDYVNASHVQAPPSHDASLRPLRYIAMQGPTEPSIPYVWRMIAEQSESPSVIVQLTSNAEGGAVKCNQYFPEGAGMTSSGSNGGQEDARWRLNEQDVWGDGWRATLTVESAELLCDDAIERRRLTLRIDGEQGPPRVIWHFWYRRWPDFGVISPGDYDTFFELMKLSREHSSPRAPRVIHCSAGVGRTGTFIALEHLLRELDVGAFRPGSSSTPSLSSAAGSQDNGSLASPRRHDVIFDTVQHLRQQRRGMVQSEQQYRFLYQVLRRRWIDTYRSHGAGTPTAAVAADEDEDDRTDDGGASLLKVPGSATASNHQLTDVESYDGSAVNQEMDDDEDDDRHDAHEQQDDQDEEDEEDDDDGGGAKVETDSLPAAPADNMTAGGISVADKLKSNAATKSPHSGAVGRAAMMKKRAKRLLFD